MKPIAFTDDEMCAILSAAKRVSRWERSSYLQIITEMLAGKPRGGGVLQRAIAAAQAATRPCKEVPPSE
jgi:hypothetical protein